MYHILIIDDEEPVVDVLKRALTRFGHLVKTASKGKEGLNLFKKNHFDLVITDIAMPFINGYDVSKHIRNSDRSHVPVIGISGTPWLLNSKDFDMTLSKPFTLKSLSETIDSVMFISPATIKACG